MRVVGWIFILGGLTAVIYGLNRETFAIMGGGVEALRDPDVQFERVLFSVLGGLFLVAGCVLAGAGAIVAAVRSEPSDAQGDQVV